jgi:hypothetical protein
LKYKSGNEIANVSCHDSIQKNIHTDNKRFKTTCESEGNALNQNLRGVYQYKPLFLFLKEEDPFSHLPGLIAMPICVQLWNYLHKYTFGYGRINERKEDDKPSL